MQTITVLKTDNISEVENGTYIHCRELNKGLMKKDFSSLGISIQTFENIVNKIESMNFESLSNIGFDTVLFGANRTEHQGEIIESNRRSKEIVEAIRDLSVENQTITYIATLLLTEQGFSKYFKIETLEAIAGSSDLTNLIIPPIELPEGIENGLDTSKFSYTLIGAYGKNWTVANIGDTLDDGYSDSWARLYGTNQLIIYTPFTDSSIKINTVGCDHCTFDTTITYLNEVSLAELGYSVDSIIPLNKGYNLITADNEAFIMLSRHS